MRELMMIGIERDIASSIAILDRLPAAERASWLARLERRNYRFVLGGSARASRHSAVLSQQFATAIADAMRPFEIVKIGQVTQPTESLQIAGAAERRVLGGGACEAGGHASVAAG
jgi:hypothetical protein